MKGVAQVEWWHVFKGELEDGTRLTCTLGPTLMSAEDVGQDGAGIKIKDRTFPMALVTDQQGPQMAYWASFDHDPEDDEQELGEQDLSPEEAP